VLREPWVRLRAGWRAALILPWAVPNYITALIWRTMFDAQYGAVNALLGLVSGQGHPASIDWFGSFSAAFCANLATNTWLGFPFMMVVTLGALQSIPREMEEAAEVDGASYLGRLRHVVWPLLRPALLPAVVLGSVWTFNMFNVVYLVSAGEPDGATEILISQAYRWAFSRGNMYGYAAAYAVIIFFVLLAYSRGTHRLMRRSVA
jgi:arabinogalactan oligomer/maltooligosaccharide transport system permease protein